MSFITVGLLVPILSASIAFGAGPTIEDAVDCVVALLSDGVTGDRAEALHRASGLALRTWLREEIAKVRESRRPRIIAAIMKTGVDDAQVPSHGLAAYVQDEGRVCLRADDIGTLLIYPRVAHELDHLFFDLDSPVASAPLRRALWILDPRSAIRRFEGRAHAAQHDQLWRVIGDPDVRRAMYDHLLDAQKLDFDTRYVIERLLQLVTFDGLKLVPVLDGQLVARFTVNPDLMKRTMDVFDRMLSGETGHLVRMERLTKSKFVELRMRQGYGKVIAIERALKLLLYGVVVCGVAWPFA